MKFVFNHTRVNRNTCIAEPHETPGGKGEPPHRKDWSKLGSLGGLVSTLALILEREM